MNLQKLHYINLHEGIAQTPQDPILIDLIGPYNSTPLGHSYALTAVCNLTGYLMTIPIPDKKTTTVAIHLFSEIMLNFSFPRILHSDNRTEFKSKLIEHLTQQLGIKKTYISPCYPQSNGKLESSHRFIKDYLEISIDGTLELDQLLPYATAAFNWLPNKHSQESPNFLYFRYDPYLPHHAAFLQPKLRYLGSGKGMTHLDKLKQTYTWAALNTKEAYSKQNIDKYNDIPQYKTGDLIMIKNFNKNQIGMQNIYPISES